MKAVPAIRVLCISVIIALSPFLLADRNGEVFAFNEAGAEIGTCCSQQGAICVIPPLAVHNFYALPPGYPCPPVWGPLPLPTGDN